jgi:hypothetical protein
MLGIIIHWDTGDSELFSVITYYDNVRGAPYSSRAGAKPLGQKDRIVRDSAPWSTTNLYTLSLTDNA